MTSKQIINSIKSNELQLNNWGKITHYGIVVFFLFIASLQVLFYLVAFFNGSSNDVVGFRIIIFLIPLILGFLFYRLQKNRLKFKMIETNLTRNELDVIIKNVATELKWNIISDSKKIVEAKTFPSFFSGSWGEQITILFDDNRILINSICDLDQKSSITSMGRNKRNINKLSEAIENANG